MTKAQIWVAGIVALFVIFFFIQELTGVETTADRVGEQEMEKNAAMTIMEQHGCFTCHGEQLEGTPKGPALNPETLGDYYDKELLINYILHPEEYVLEDRYKAMQGNYKAVMPSYHRLDKETVAIIAEYLLGESK